MCQTCEIDLVTIESDENASGPGELIPPRPSKAQVKAMVKQVHAEALERNRLRAEPWPICSGCDRVVCVSETHEMYGGLCLCCGINRLEKLFFRLWRARTRRGRRKALKCIARLARQSFPCCPSAAAAGERSLLADDRRGGREAEDCSSSITAAAQLARLLGGLFTASFTLQFHVATSKRITEHECPHYRIPNQSFQVTPRPWSEFTAELLAILRPALRSRGNLPWNGIRHPATDRARLTSTADLTVELVGRLVSPGPPRIRRTVPAGCCGTAGPMRARLPLRVLHFAISDQGSFELGPARSERTGKSTARATRLPRSSSTCGSRPWPTVGRVGGTSGRTLSPPAWP